MSRYREPNCSLIVRNMADGARSEELKKMFSEFGPLKDVYIPLDYHSKRQRGFAYIQFEDPRDAKDAQNELNGKRYLNSELRIDFAQGDRKTPGEMRDKEKGGRDRGRYYDDRRHERSRSRGRRYDDHDEYDRRRRCRSRSRSRNNRRDRSDSRPRRSAGRDRQLNSSRSRSARRQHSSSRLNNEKPKSNVDSPMSGKSPREGESEQSSSPQSLPGREE